MKIISLKEKHKTRIGPKDYKRNSRAKRTTGRAINFIFVSMVSSIVFMISYL